MNVNDVVITTHINKPIDQALNILERQGMLESKYWDIEKRYSPVIDVNDKRGQIVIKDFLWRITEEIGEAIESRSNNETLNKTWEELADGLHFVAGLCVITSNQNIFTDAWERVYETSDTGSESLFLLQNLVEALGTLGNTLKMKPWKQTDVLTDITQFRKKLYDVVLWYLLLCLDYGMTLTDLWIYYYKKSEVNLFRIRSKY